MACFASVRYRGIGGDEVASLWAATVSKRQQEVQDASLARDRTSDMECWYVMVEYSLVIASIFSFRTMGQWEHWDYYSASTFCIS